MKNTITLSELANKREIFIDYSAVFNTHFVNMMIEQARPLHDAQKQITVHRSVLNEAYKNLLKMEALGTVQLQRKESLSLMLSILQE